MLWCCLLLLAPGDIIVNGGFETLADGYPAEWSRGWCRDGADHMHVAPSTDDPHEGATCLLIRHTGERDWSVNPGGPREVRPGDIYDMSVWVRISGEGEVVLSAAVYPGEANDQNTQWSAGAVVARGPTAGWVRLQTRLVIDPGMVTAQPRLIGTGPVEAAVDEFSVVPAGNLDVLRAAYAGPHELAVRSRALEASISPAAGSVVVRDRRTGRVWRSLAGGSVVARSAAQRGTVAEMQLLDAARGLELLVRAAAR